MGTSVSAPGSLFIPNNFEEDDHYQDEPRADQTGGRSRGLSVNDSAQANVDHDYFELSRQAAPGVNVIQPTPKPSQLALLVDDGSSIARAKTPDFLAPPSPNGYSRGPRHSTSFSEPASPQSKTSSGFLLSDSDSELASQRLTESPRPTSRQSASPPPPTRHESLSIDSASLNTVSGRENWKVVKYWPYHILPAPQLLFATLFPTLRDFGGKSHMEKVLGCIALPSVFLLTITLPVVESRSGKKENTPTVVVESGSPVSTVAGMGTSSGTADLNDAANGGSPDGSSPKEWNRWLVAVQCITAPVFLVAIFLIDDEDTRILKPMLYALLGGLIALGFLLVLTVPERPPRLRYLLCFAGFVVAIGWISAIANEVVGVLKAFGVIFGISDAILGLTIFAIVSLSHGPPICCHLLLTILGYRATPWATLWQT